MEAILQDWENFARDVWPTASPNVRNLRDHAKEMLLAVILDMQTKQSKAEQAEKSTGNGQTSASSDMVDLSSERHAEGRRESGFDLRTLVAEYRALRASVLHLWSQASPEMAATQISDMTRFNECVDQLLAESVMSYTESVDQSRELFLGILGHDLRSPLCAVTTAAGLLEEKAELTGPARRLASLIVVSAQAMRSLVADLLDFAGTRLGAKMNVSRVAMNLAQLCREVMKEIETEHPSRDFQFESNGDGNGEWDRQRLRQLMSNLLVNAVQHGAEETPIRVYIKDDGDDVVLGVCNQGPPIPAAERTTIFDPLRRRTDDDGLSPGSLGLGLYIAREVASAHGGQIEVNSDEQETVFTVKLPRTDREVLQDTLAWR